MFVPTLLGAHSAAGVLLDAVGGLRPIVVAKEDGNAEAPAPAAT